MQTALSKIWPRVAKSIFYIDNRFTICALLALMGVTGKHFSQSFNQQRESFLANQIAKPAEAFSLVSVKIISALD